MTLMRLSCAALLLLLMACGGNAATSTPPPGVTPAAVTAVSPTLTPGVTSAPVTAVPPTITPVVTFTPTTTPEPTSTQTPGVGVPNISQVSGPPLLSKVDPEVAAPGETLRIEGSGGRIELRAADGKVTGYLESPSIFFLFLDGDSAGGLGCAANTCSGKLTVPVDAPPGLHEISVEGYPNRALTVVVIQVATPVAFTLRISSFPSIPVRNTCDGEDVSPSLAWTTVPPGTETFLIVMDDPDAPGGTWAHWVVFNIPGDSRGLDENRPKIPHLPDGGVQGSNTWGNIGYGGPCPPAGPAHNYRFFIYAVDTSLDLPAGVSREQVADALDGHIVAEHMITRTYGR